MMTTKFLNIDLDLRVKEGHQELLEAFGSAVIDLQESEKENCASLELAEQPRSVEDAILSFYDLISALPPRARTIWNECEMRSMNIGFQAGATPNSKDFHISNKAISLLSSINAEIVVTIYAAEV